MTPTEHRSPQVFICGLRQLKSDMVVVVRDRKSLTRALAATLVQNVLLCGGQLVSHHAISHHKTLTEKTGETHPARDPTGRHA